MSSLPAMKACLFDLDGTLIDSLEDLADAVNRMLVESGYPQQPLSVFPKYIGDGAHKLVERALPEEAREEGKIQLALQGYMRHYEDTWDKKSKPYPGMVELLQDLRSRGYQIGVLSNKPHDFTVKCCTHFFASGTFDLVFGQRPHIARKPDPAGALETLHHFGCSPAEAYYLGDSGVDMQLASNAGMYGVGVLWGFRGEEELRENGAKRLIASPEELLNQAAE